MRNILFCVISLVLFTRCTNAPITGNDVVGAREFVIDSYKIKEGKLSILELEGKETEVLDDALLVEEKDVISNGDVIEVSLYHPSRKDVAPYIQEISNKMGYKIEEGMLFLPDLSPMNVTGITIEELRKKVQQCYQKQIPDVEVFVFYKKRTEKNVEIIGMVKNNQVSIHAKTRLFDVLSKAGLGSSANLFKSYVVRDKKTLPIDLYKLIHEGDMSQNIVMKNGDKIFIADANASAIMIIGEVAKQGVINLNANSIGLQEALAKAGGMLFTGNKAYIQVIRGNLAKPKIYTLNWRHIVRLPTDSLLLMPGDIVYVAANPISEWNRFINQLLPSFTVYELFAKGIKGIIIQDGIGN